MTEKPLLFSAPMIRALLAGTKTQTRRAVKWRGLERGLNMQFTGLSVERSGSNFVLTSPTRTSHEYRSVPQPCPYGVPGDRLWVRETWAYHVHSQSAARDEDGPFVYAADGQRALQMRLASKWTPGIHMFRWASRITLEITEVRVERLQSISEADAIAEGIQRWPLGYRVAVSGAPKHESRTFDGAQSAYRWLWESINGLGSWDANPYVWCVSFKVVRP